MIHPRTERTARSACLCLLAGWLYTYCMHACTSADEPKLVHVRTFTFAGEVGRMQDRQATASSPPSGSDTSSSSSSSSAPRRTEDSREEGMASDDDDIGTVPELGLGPSTSGISRDQRAAVAAAGTTSSSNAAVQGATTSTSAGARRRGRSPADKEHRRLKRLLRNRVSAQQARERKKAYVGELEARVKELERSNLELDERVATLHNENQMLRQVLKNTTANKRAPPGGGGGGDSK